MKENLWTPRSIRTRSGQYVNVFEPDPDTIVIEDIAHALSQQCRFGGHLPEFFSVLEHSISVMHVVDEDEFRLSALMHDASEAYLLDMPRPIKQELANYKEIEDRLMRVIAEKFGFQWPMPEVVKKADEAMLQLEWEVLMLGRPTQAPLPRFEGSTGRQAFIRYVKHYTRSTQTAP